MGLLDETFAHQSRKGPECTVRIVKAMMTKKDATELEEVLALGVQYKALAKALQARGYNIGPDTLSRHKRGDCACRSETK